MSKEKLSPADFVSVAEAATLLGFSHKNNVYPLIRNRTFTAYKARGRDTKLLRAQVEEYLIPKPVKVNS